MSKVSKLFIMALLVLAMISVSLNVNAANADLTAYIGTAHTINGMIFELSNAQKATLNSFASKIDDATSDAIMNDIMAAENVVRNSGVTNHNSLTKAQQDQIIAYAKSAASKAGAVLEINLSSRTYKLTKNGKVVIAGNVDSLVVDPGAAPTGGSSSSSASTASTSKLLYTGANYALYTGAVCAIVAVAVVIKKRV